MTSTGNKERLDRLLSFIQHDPLNLALRREAIGEAFLCQEWGKVAQLLEDGLAFHPDDVDLLDAAAAWHQHQHRFDDAIEMLSMARLRGIDALRLRYQAARAHFMQMRFAEALDELRIPDLARAVPASLTLRARCLHGLERIEEAIENCNRRLEVEPHDADTAGLLALLYYEQSRLSEASALAEQALSRVPDQLEAMLTVASLYSAACEYSKARSAFNALLLSHPSCGRAWLGRALADMSTARFDEAKASIDKAAQYMPNHIGTWHVLAWLNVLSGDANGAEAAFERALELDRNFAETHGGLAVAAAMQGREIEAQEMIRRALRLDANAMSTQYARLLVLRSMGRHDDARAVVEAFLARPVPNGDMQMRDLLIRRMPASIARGVSDKTLH